MPGAAGKGALGSETHQRSSRQPYQPPLATGKQAQAEERIRVQMAKQPFVAAQDGPDNDSVREEPTVAPSVRGEGRHFLHHTWGDADARTGGSDMPVIGGQKPVPKHPEIKIALNAGIWELTEIKVFSAIYVRLASPGAAPKVKENVLNNPDNGVRTPRDDPKGVGYWMKVAENLGQYDGKHNSTLQWDVTGATKFHEEKHREADVKWLNDNWKDMQPRALVDLRTRIAELLDQLNDRSLVTPELVSSLAGGWLWPLFEAHLPPINEEYPYAETRKAYYLPAVEKIKREAQALGW